MKRLHALVAALSLGGAFAAVSAAQAADFDPVEAGSMGGPGAAVEAPLTRRPPDQMEVLLRLFNPPPARDIYVAAGGTSPRSTVAVDAILDLTPDSRPVAAR
ncbi:MAG TPA: hypothetical protein VK698_17510 [Kofleriaceae bacterium]|nr:hypothetical protein [Kofleriaceae bacterium]